MHLKSKFSKKKNVPQLKYKRKHSKFKFDCRVRVALTEDGVPMSTLREIALLKQLDAFKHPNIVKFVLIFVKDR